ncbi:hypothetical protein VTG60DRAFT_5236 [Thermothelomyces hinnuleus]
MRQVEYGWAELVVETQAMTVRSRPNSVGNALDCVHGYCACYFHYAMEGIHLPACLRYSWMLKNMEGPQLH